MLVNLCDVEDFEITEPDCIMNSVTDPELSSALDIMELMLSDDLLDFL